MESEEGFILLEKWGLRLVLPGKERASFFSCPETTFPPPQAIKRKESEGKERKVCLAVVSRPLPLSSRQQKVS